MYLKLIFIIVLLILFIDWYFYRAIKSFVQQWKPIAKKTIKIIYWSFTAFTILFMFFVANYYIHKTMVPTLYRTYVFGIILIITFSKIIGSLFILLHDLKTIFLSLKQKTFKSATSSKNITRKEFLKKSAIITAAIPFATLIYGVFKSAFDFTVRKQKLNIKNLPNSFNGLKIIQISDIHIGSFLTDTPIKKIVSLINEQNADIVFFTGDLVNDVAEEALPFIDVLKQITAPLGVFSILGNHDYGDYFYQKNDVEGKKHNYELMKNIHQKLGWNLLLNKNHILIKNNERLVILGVENWGSLARFQKFGDIFAAKKGTLKNDVKLLLSHDPSHWEAKILPHHPDVAVTFSGHTHGMQFGIEIPGFKWSPAKYLYKYWAGLYTKNKQKIYVNRGLGFIGYPGRIGILPEITVFTLNKV